MNKITVPTIQWLLVISLVVTAVLVGCSASPGQPAAKSKASEPKTWDEIVKAGREEGGPVTHYAGIDGGPLAFELGKKFNETYPEIAVNVVVADGKAAAERVRTEQRVGKYVADVLRHGSTDMLAVASEGYFEPFIPPNVANLPDMLKPLVAPGATTLPLSAGGIYAIGVNTDLIKAPESWWDLTKPEYKKKITIQNPREAGGGYSWFQSTYETLGEEFHKGIAANEPFLNSSSRDLETSVVRGQFAVLIPAKPRIIKQYENTPLKWFNPKEGGVISMDYIALVKNAPHMNAAKVWINWLYSKEAQEMMAKEGAMPLLADIKAPKGFSWDEKILAVAKETPDAKTRTAGFALARKIYGE